MGASSGHGTITAHMHTNLDEEGDLEVMEVIVLLIAHIVFALVFSSNGPL